MVKTTFTSVYPCYIKKVEIKGRTIQELHEIIAWLTGFDDKKLQELIDELAQGKKMEKIFRGVAQ
jgi:hypothetical protein